MVPHRRHRRPADDVFASCGVVAVDGRLVAAGGSLGRQVLEPIAGHDGSEVVQAAERHLFRDVGRETSQRFQATQS